MWHRGTRRPDPLTASGLRRLRLRLTIFYTLVSAAGLAALAAFMLLADGRLRSNALDADLRLQAERAGGNVWFDEQYRLHTEGILNNDAVMGGYPQTYVTRTGDELEDGTPSVTVVVSPRSPYYASIPLADITRDVVGDGSEAIWRAPQNESTPIRFLAAPLTDGDGTPRGAIVTVADEGDLLTSRRRLWLYVSGGGVGLLLMSALAGFLLSGRSLRPAIQALNQQERFLADAAHEIRTPIAAIRALAEGAAAGDQPRDEALERTADIAGHAGRTVDDLLFLARADAGRLDVRREPLRLDLLVEEALEVHEGVAFVGEPTIVSGDPILLRRAVSNLVGNAVAHGRALDPTASIAVSVAAGRVVVEDAGPGIEPGIASDVFERFSSGRRSGGTGLGLPLTRLIAQAHGGEVSLSPRAGGGTIAMLSLPVADGTGAGDATAARASNRREPRAPGAAG